MTGTSELETLKDELLAEIAAAQDLGQLEAVRVKVTGKKGPIAAQMAKLATLPPEERKAFGAANNAVKAVVTQSLDARKGDLEAAALEARLANERADVTLPVRFGPEALG